MLEALGVWATQRLMLFADIVDNSVSAGATEVRIHFSWEGGERAFISILDNGCGMNDPELEAAIGASGRGGPWTSAPTAIWGVSG